LLKEEKNPELDSLCFEHFKYGILEMYALWASAKNTIIWDKFYLSL
jgi:hypothetical protein